MTTQNLSGKVALIQGGSRGIGAAIVKRLAAEGATVAFTYVSSTAKAEALQDSITGNGGKALAIKADSADAEAIRRAVTTTVETFGRLDILVNNAGVLGEVKPVWETSPENFQRVLQVNLFGSYLVTRAVVGRMRQQTPRPSSVTPHALRGHVVNIASIQGKEGMANAVAYSASKAGLMALTKSVAKETAQDGIIVTAITPAAAETAMAREISAERRADILGRIPMGRFVEIEEVARMVLWLSSDECSFSTGGIFDLSGGRATY